VAWAQFNHQLKKPWVGFLLIWVAVFCGAGFKALPRLFNDPSPYSESRYHHEFGDGATETLTLMAHRSWSSYGYGNSYFLPCFDEQLKKDCVPYTHYPPGSFLLSSFLMTLFEKMNNNDPLILTRVVIFVVTVSLFTTGLFFITSALDLNLFVGFLSAIFVSSRRGFWVYSDNMFFLGIVTALTAIAFGIILYLLKKNPLQKNGILVAYATICFSAFWLTFESLVALGLLPVLLLLDYKNNKKITLQLMIVVFLVYFTGILMRSSQNILALGGVAQAWDDITQVAKVRQSLPDFNLWPYIKSNLTQYRLLGSTVGAMIGLVSLGILIYLKKYKELLLLGLASMFILSWNGIMIQHSAIHGFTHRPVVLVLALVMLLGLDALFKVIGNRSHA
jgi:hypothetical protein